MDKAFGQISFHITGLEFEHPHDSPSTGEVYLKWRGAASLPCQQAAYKVGVRSLPAEGGHPILRVVKSTVQRYALASSVQHAGTGKHQRMQHTNVMLQELLHILLEHQQ